MNLKSWWRGFVARNLVAADPDDAARDAAAVRPADVVAEHAPSVRVIPAPCRRPSGAYVMGWHAFGSCDAEIVEVIWAAWVLGQRTGATR